MKARVCGVALVSALLIGGIVLTSCAPRIDNDRKVEAIFIKHLNKTAAKLALSPEQKVEFDRLKEQIHQNFQEGRIKRHEIIEAIRKEAAQQNPDITKMTLLFQGFISDEAQRINSTFDLMLEFNKKLDQSQRDKLTKIISDWVAHWH
jgi:hypothetical protein